MKKRILLLLLCGLVMSTTSAWRLTAQDNTTWKNAQVITAGEEITTTFTPGTIENRWYKIKITEGKWYEIPYLIRYSFYLQQDGQSTLGNPWYGYGYNDSYSGFRAPQFKATETTNLYIHSGYLEGMNTSYTWSFIEVTDNRVCDNAELIQLNQEINLPTGQKFRWYKTTFEADKYYLVESSLSVGIYAACDGTRLGFTGNVFHSETAGDYYFKAEVTKENSTFKVYEVPKQTNTTKETALQLEFDKQVMYSHIFGMELYFKANLEKGKTYEVIGNSEITFSWYSTLEVTDENGNAISNIKGVYSPNGFSKYFTAPESGVYFIRRMSNNYSTMVYRMTFDEITDPRICTYAVPVTEGQNVTYNHKAYSELWWKIDVQAGNLYYVSFKNQNTNEQRIRLYSECGSETYLTESAGIFKFPASTTGTYYLEMYATRLQDEFQPDNSFQITKTVNQNNTDIASAFLFEPNNSIITSHSYGETLWYKVKVEAGKVYELNGKLISDEQENLSVYASNGTDIVTGGYSRPLRYLIPDTDTLYYIKWSGNASSTFEWSFNVVNDNRVIQGAETVTLGEDISLTPENSYPNNRYWFKVNFKGGEFYEIDFSNAEYHDATWYVYGDQLRVWDATGQVSLGSYFQSKPLFTPKEDTVFYLEISRISETPSTTLVWKVNQLQQGDNRLCEYAQEVAVGANVETKHYTNKYQTQWYKATLQEGKVYEIDLAKAIHGMYYHKGNPCGAVLSFPEDNRIANGEKTLIYAAETSVYYFLSYTQNLNSTQSDFTWKIEEVEGDNRLCNFATEIELGKEFIIDHKNTRTRWYKVDVNKDFLYSVDYSSIGHLDYKVYVYDGCDLTEYITSGSYVKEFAFMAKSTGTYYFKCVNTTPTGNVPCTIAAITDNRSCLYPIEVAKEEVISATSIPKIGLWYKINLEADSIYEFDLTNTPYSVKGKLYSDCEQTLALVQGQKERMLFKPTQTSTYLFHLEPDYSQNTSWSWSYKSIAQGDNRLCEYAIEATSDTIEVNIADGIKQFWYTCQVEAGKFYMIGSNDGLEIEVYTACGQDKPVMTVRELFVYKATNTVKFYLRVKGYNLGEGVIKSWYAFETSPDGRFCEHPLNVKLGTEIISSANQMGTGGIWYHFMPETSGFYTITSDWAPIGDNDTPYGRDYFWAIFVYKNCNITDFADPNDSTLLIAHCGHYSGTPDLSFKAEANTDYKILVGIFHNSICCDHTWSISKLQTNTGIIDVSLVDTQGNVINAKDACVMLYQKIGDAILSADTLTYNSQSVFRSKDLGYGTYLLYANNIGQGLDGKKYLPGWYENAGVWEDATEITLDEATKWITFRPTAAPDDIMQGNVTISGAVYEEGESGQTGKKNVDISVYRKKPQGQGAPMLTANSPRRIVSEILWELVARIKTDATGQYEINNLPAGSYMIMVDLPGYATENSGIEINAQEGQSYKNNNFETDEENKTIKKVATSLNNVEAYGIKLYPNPFDKEIVIENVKDSRLEIYNANGLRVYTQELKQEQETIQVNHLPIGVYYFRIVKDGEANSFVAIKKK